MHSAPSLTVVFISGLTVDDRFGQLAVLGMRGPVGQSPQAKFLDMTPGMGGDNHRTVELFRHR